MNTKTLNTTATVAAVSGNKSSTAQCCSTPYVSPPSSPGRLGYFYSAPSSPVHHFLKSSTITSPTSDSPSLHGYSGAVSDRSSFEFDFGVSSLRDENADDDDRSETMISADELFLNGQIRPMNISSHSDSESPQTLAPLIDNDGGEVEIEAARGRDLNKLRERSLRRKGRSLSPLIRNENDNVFEENGEKNSLTEENESSKNHSTPSSRWVFLKGFRSKSEGSTSLWSSISFTHSKTHKTEKLKQEYAQTAGGGTNNSGRLRNGIGVRRSAHEAHYSAKRAQAEEMRRKTFLPYRQGLLGCLGFSSKSYRAMDGFTKALNCATKV